MDCLTGVPPDAVKTTMLVDSLDLHALPVLSTAPLSSGGLGSMVQSTVTDLTHEVARLHPKPVYDTHKEAGREPCLPGIPSLSATNWATLDQLLTLPWSCFVF